MTSPSVAGRSRRIVRPSVVLPHPDSPTRPSVSPRLICKLTSSTAWTLPTTRRRNPPWIGKYFLTFLTSTSVSATSRRAVRSAEVSAIAGEVAAGDVAAAERSADDIAHRHFRPRVELLATLGLVRGIEPASRPP